MAYCESVYAYNSEKDINLNSQFEYALTIGIMIDENYHASFTSLEEDLIQLLRNMYRLRSDNEIMQKINSSKSKLYLLETIDNIYNLGLNWCNELTEDPGEDIENLRKLVTNIKAEATAGMGIFSHALENIREDNQILKERL